MLYRQKEAMEMSTLKAKKGKIKSDRLEEHEVNKMLSLPDKRSKAGLRDYLVMRLLFETGIRKGELCSLKICSLMTYAGGYRVRVKSLKKELDEYRELEITQELYNTLQRYLKLEFNGTHTTMVFPLFMTLGDRGGHTKQGITPRAVDLIVKRYKDKAGIDKRITPHSFRSGLASTLLVEKKFDLQTVREILGHASITTTQIYLSSTDAKKREAIQSLNLT